jgi:hypothetical protein
VLIASTAVLFLATIAGFIVRSRQTDIARSSTDTPDLCIAAASASF